jgi:hypothetical protein
MVVYHNWRINIGWGGGKLDMGYDKYVDFVLHRPFLGATLGSLSV